MRSMKDPWGIMNECKTEVTLLTFLKLHLGDSKARFASGNEAQREEDPGLDTPPHW